MVMTLQLTRMVVMMAKLNMGCVKTKRAVRRIGWNGESSQRAFVAENLKTAFRESIGIRVSDLLMVPSLLMTMNVFLSA